MSTRHDGARRDFARIAGILTVVSGALLALTSGCTALAAAVWLAAQGRGWFALAAVVVGVFPVLTGIGMARGGLILAGPDKRMSGEPPR